MSNTLWLLKVCIRLVSRKPLYKHEKICGYLERKQLCHSKVLLDAGGKDGLIVERFSCAKERVVVDISRQWLKESSSDLKIVADLNWLPFKSNVFDLAIFSEVLEHLENPISAVKELARTCKSVVMTTPNNTILRRVFWIIRRKGDLSSSGHVREFSPKEVSYMFRDAGFKLAEFKGIGFIIERPRLMSKLLRHLDVIPYSAPLSSKMLMLFN